MKYKGFTITFANIDANRMYRTETATTVNYWPTFTTAARYVLTCTRQAEEEAQRKQKAIGIATTALRQIKAAPADIWQSWAMARPRATHYGEHPALCFEVNALQHTGRVMVTLDESRDLYDIRTLTDTGETLQERTGVFCDQLAHVIDTMIERPEGMTDEEYKAALHALNDPLTDFLLNKAEQGQQPHIIHL